MTIICHSCNTANSDNAEFCKQCGTLMRMTKKVAAPIQMTVAPEAASASVPASAAEVFCPHCAHANSPTARFCKSCGESIVAAAKLTGDSHDVKTLGVLSAGLPATPLPYAAPAVTQSAAPLASTAPDIDNFDKIDPTQRSGKSTALVLAAVVAVAGLVGGGWFWWGKPSSATDNNSTVTAMQPQPGLTMPVSRAATGEPQPPIVTEMKDGTIVVGAAAPAGVPDSAAGAGNTVHSKVADAGNSTSAITGESGSTGHSVGIVPATVSVSAASAASAAAAQRNAERRAKTALATYPPAAQTTAPPAAAYYRAAPAPAPPNLYQAPQQVVTVVSSPPAGFASPREVCSGQTNAALTSCISSQCQLPRFFSDPQCGNLRRDRENTDRQDQLSN